TWRLPGIGQPLLRCLNSGIHAVAMPGKSVRRGGAFRQHIHVLAKRNRHRADSPCGACRPHLTAAQGPRVEQRAILARTRYATAARLREQKSRDAKCSIGNVARAATKVCYRSILLKNSLFARRTFGRRRDRQSIGEENERASALERYAGRPFASSCTVGINRLAIRRRFCAIAAIKNSSCAPCRPRKRNRFSRRMRLR